MQKMKRAGIILIVVLIGIAFSGCSLIASIMPFEEDAFDWEAVSFDGYGYAALPTETQRKFYAYFDKYVHRDTPEPFRFDYTQEAQRLAMTADIYLMDHPDVFWVDEESALDIYSYGDEYMMITISYTQEGEALQRMRQQLQAEVQTVTQALPADCSEYEREITFNDWMVDNVTYNSTAAASDDFAVGNEHNAYGALVEKTCVCDGYAKAFKLLCDSVGMVSTVLLGTTETDSETDYHAWNAVQIGGEWYQLDITWNVASEEAVPGIGRYFDFNLTSEQIEKEHTLLPLYREDADLTVPYNYFIPACTATEYNYFLRSFPTYSDAGSDAFCEDLADAARSGEEYFVFNVDAGTDMEALFKQLIEGDAAEAIENANALNGVEAQLDARTYIYHDEPNRVIILGLTYLS